MFPQAPLSVTLDAPGQPQCEDRITLPSVNFVEIGPGAL